MIKDDVNVARSQCQQLLRVLDRVAAKYHDTVESENRFMGAYGDHTVKNALSALEKEKCVEIWGKCFVSFLFCVKCVRVMSRVLLL